MFWLLPDYRKLVDVGHHSCSSSFSNGIVAVEVKLRDLQSTKDLVSPAQATPRIVTVTLPTLAREPQVQLIIAGALLTLAGLSGG
jgi:hypothetical protein